MPKNEVFEAFTLMKTETADGMFLTVSPFLAADGFKPKTIPITPEFWDSLRFSFATKVFDASKDKKVLLAYIK